MIKDITINSLISYIDYMTSLEMIKQYGARKHLTRLQGKSTACLYRHATHACYLCLHMPIYARIDRMEQNRSWIEAQEIW